MQIWEAPLGGETCLDMEKLGMAQALMAGMEIMNLVLDFIFHFSSAYQVPL